MFRAVILLYLFFSIVGSMEPFARITPNYIKEPGRCYADPECFTVFFILHCIFMQNKDSEEGSYCLVDLC